ncbi:hypothetical protein WH47_00283 [Habropoda laboriosa]|uniref:Uncharacterized protein n=1 Tax=Habropoda laboriosa TaxID=597456 RepID=A0A0L7R1N8_9HYME|nr:hypothetical protein WH47_00283 [Habropoda laboriosa]
MEPNTGGGTKDDFDKISRSHNTHTHILHRHTHTHLVGIKKRSTRIEGIGWLEIFDVRER